MSFTQTGIILVKMRSVLRGLGVARRSASRLLTRSLQTSAFGARSLSMASWGAVRPAAVQMEAKWGVRSFSEQATEWFVPAHGPTGKLKELLVPEEQLQALKDEAIRLPSVVLSHRQLCDIELLLNGGFSPLDGFMTEAEYNSVVESERLPDGTLFPMPITLDVSAQTALELALEGIGNSKSDEKGSVALKDREGNIIAVLDVEDIWQPDKQVEADKVFGGDPEHPAIHYLNTEAGDVYIGGALRGLQLPPHYDLTDLRDSPAELRAKFVEQFGEEGTVVAFQTRNPLHRAHVELTKKAMEDTGGALLLHPVVGMTKPGDVDHHTRVKCYRQVINRYPEKRAVLSALPLAMRMGGPREAIWHAIIRKNYGATHFIVGRDHAGPGSNSAGEDFYSAYAARDAVKSAEEELGIGVCAYEMMVYVPHYEEYFPINGVPGGKEVLKLSGTEVRRRLRTGEPIPEWFSYKEVVQILRKAHPPRAKQGFCLFFTGLSGSGKTTVAQAVMERLMEMDDRSICLLDGDHVRQMLSSELGFSKEHRDLNIKRIGFVAAEVVKPGGCAIAAPIAPYAEPRRYARRACSKYGGFVEVYVSTSVEECEKRDRKGLYKKAREGLLKGLTGVDDPYETPENAEITIDTAKLSVTESAEQIMEYLIKEGYVNPRSL